MAKKGSTGKRYAPTEPTARPLVETNGAKAIKVMEALVAKFTALDLDDRDAVKDARQLVYADLDLVFGDESHERSVYWQSDESHLLEVDENEDDGAWHRAEKLVNRTEERDRIVARLGRLVVRARELAELHGSMKGNDDMGIRATYDKMSAPFTLVKASGDRVSNKGIRDTGKGSLLVYDERFDAEAGDRIEFPQPNGKVETWEVANSSYVPVPHMPEMAHYTVKLTRASARPVAPPPIAAPLPTPQQVVHQTHYNIHNSTVGAIGENATVASSHVIGQATQWNGHDPKAIGAEIAMLRKQLATAAGGDGADAEQAAEDLGHVTAANKALTANDEGAFKTAIKKLSAFGMKLLGQVATAATMAYLQHHGILPAPEHAALPPGGK